MIILIDGASHSGKTYLAQKALEKYKIPYLSIDLLKMGLIRSGNTKLKPEQDQELKEYLWPIVSEIIKTAIENKQNLIVEGAYIPFNYKDYFEDSYLKDIDYYCIILSRNYIDKHFDRIRDYENIIEKRLSSMEHGKDELIRENEYNLEMCKKYNNKYILIEEDYKLSI